MKKADCIFCKIVKGEIPSYNVFENNDLLVILDAFPAQEGHLLIITKNHYENIFDLPEKIAAQVLPVGQKVVKAMEKSLHPHGYNFLQNNHFEAGQEVMHYHMHIVPRYSGRGGRGTKYVLHPEPYKFKPSKEDLKKITEKIKKSLK